MGPPEIAAICPYLLAVGGQWRSARPSREHRCTAVATPLPIALDKQQSLCLTSGHASCPRFLTARAHAEDDAPLLERVWGFGSTAPVLLERPAFHLDRIRQLGGRTVGQVLLGLLMILAFVAVVLARTAVPG